MKRLPSIPKLIIYLLITVIIVGALGYVFWLNPENITIHLTKEKNIELPAAIAIIAIFFSGSLFMFLAMLIFLLTQKFAYGKLKRSTELKRNHQNMIIEARALVASGTIKKGRAIYSKIVRQDPDNVMARILLAETFKKENEPKEALKVLDDARVSQKQNLELLFLASELNEEINNPTAAKDNLALAFKVSPQSLPALKGLVRLSRTLKDYSEALEYQDYRIKLSPSNIQKELQKEKAEIELELINEENKDNEEKKLEEILKLLKRHKDYAPALIEAAKLESKFGLKDKASKKAILAYKLSYNVEALNFLSNMWIDEAKEEKAISSVRNAILSHPLNSKEACNGVFFLASLLLHLEKVEDATSELSKASSILKELGIYSSVESIILAKIAIKNNETSKALKILEEVLKKTNENELNYLFLK